ncbi:MAG: hypothetical protein CM1200mP29_13010 [Verrucomicrobiota bacterium]|nr:MAG: hypothetical protein CM1200mP29_13010 [Verrucomicrobiota bacterium]
MLRKKFNLRGCRPLKPTERDYKHCLYGHLQHCSAPAWKVTLDDYRRQVTEACDYLEGQTGEWEKELEARCGRPLGRDFEKAARYRDMISDLARPPASRANSPGCRSICPGQSTPDATSSRLASRLA